MNNNSIANFDILAHSRHPKPQFGYDAANHRYFPDYVEPPQAGPFGFGYFIDLDASPGFEKKAPPLLAAVKPPVDIDLPGKGIDDLLNDLNQGPTISGGPGDGSKPPDEVVSYTWTIKKGRQLVQQLTLDPKLHGAGFWKAVNLRLPSPGQYQISLQVKLTDGSQVSSSRNYRLREAVVVVLGESFASGEGNPDTVGTVTLPIGATQCNLTTLSAILNSELEVDISLSNEPRWQEPRAHRSYRSGFSLAAEAVEKQTQTGADLVTFLNFARSGGQIARGLIAPNDSDESWTLEGQIGEARRVLGKRQIDALLVSIGGNDIGFSGRLTDLVKNDFPWVTNLTSGGDDTKNREHVIQGAIARIKTLEAEFRALAAVIKSELNPRQVFLVEYPTGLFERRRAGKVVLEGGCDIFSGLDLDIDRKDAEAISMVGKMLNLLLHRMAADNAWILIDGIDAGFAGHGYCDDDSFFVDAEESCRRQGDFDGTMHPNHKGHEVYRDRIVAVLKERLFKRTRPFSKADILPTEVLGAKPRRSG